jgi:hypothetical protein
MNNDDIVGVSTVSTLTALFNSKTDKWNVESVIIQKRTKDGKNWEEKKIETKASDLKLDKALSDVFLTSNIYLNSVNGDMFSEDTKEETPVLEA